MHSSRKLELQWPSFIRFVIGLALVASPMAAGAQGFGINEVGTCAASRGFAVTGSPCSDASAIFWNPAATTGLSGWSAYGGVTFISIDGSFTQDTTFRKYDANAPMAVVPHVFLNYHPAGSKLAYGLGLYVPYGLTSQWADTFPGRFQAQKAALKTVYVQPNIAYQISNAWSIGGGPVIGRSSVELIQGLDLSQQIVPGSSPAATFAQLGIPAGTEFGTAKLKGDATAYGFHVGAYGKLSQNWTVGARFLSSLTFKYDNSKATFAQVQTGIVLPANNPICLSNPAACGDASTTRPDTLVAPMDAILQGQFTGGGPLVDQGVSTEITHPAQVEAGFGYSGFKDWLLSADVAWVGWKQFKTLPVTFQGAAAGSSRSLIEDYNNSTAIRLGAQRAFTSGAQLRFGFAGVASAAPDETVTPLLPEQDRAYYSLGGAYPINSMFTIEGAYLRVQAPGKRGRIVERTSRAQTADQLNSGKYELSANVFSFSLKASF
jgi:long-chain fatty acid transport protein